MLSLWRATSKVMNCNVLKSRQAEKVFLSFEFRQILVFAKYQKQISLNANSIFWFAKDLIVLEYVENKNKLQCLSSFGLRFVKT
jgi:hypothetical protein